jgi:hypothetical protein
MTESHISIGKVFNVAEISDLREAVKVMNC